MGQNAVDQSDCRILKSTISLEQEDEKSDFLHVDTYSWKLKSSLKNIELGMIENGFGHSGLDSKIGCISKRN